MSKTFRHCFLILTVFALAGLIAGPLSAGPSLAEDTPRHEVRMEVDFTVLPVVLPDGSEAPAPTRGNEAPLETDDYPSAGQDTPQATPEAAPEAADAGTPGPADQAAEPAPAPAPEDGETPALATPQGTGVIRSVTLDETSLGFSIMVVADRPVGKTRVMTLDNPKRLVVDILGKWKHQGPNVLRSEGAVRHVVMGLHPDLFRMVVHFRTPPSKPLTPDVKKAGDEVHVLVAMP